MNKITIPSKKAVTRAGEVLRVAPNGSPEYEAAFDVLSSWRALYAYPLNTFNVLLRKKCQSLRIVESIVARRLKRTPSIITKLQRFPSMQLHRMQDIGGLRAVVPNIKDVYRLHNALLNSRAGHEPKEDYDDYITHPKADGYRSLHQVFKYRSSEFPEISELGLLVEIQIRTRLQHAWATAIETHGVLKNASIKVGIGTDDDKQFFRMASALFAHHEGTQLPEGFEGRDIKSIAEEFQELEQRIGMFAMLSSVSLAATRVPTDGAYCLVSLDTEKRKVSLVTFAEDDLDAAEDHYAAMEGRFSDDEAKFVVLVSVENLKDLRKAYPNCFLDTTMFIKKLREICSALS